MDLERLEIARLPKIETFGLLLSRHGLRRVIATSGHLVTVSSQPFDQPNVVVRKVSIGGLCF